MVDNTTIPEKYDLKHLDYTLWDDLLIQTFNLKKELNYIGNPHKRELLEYYSKKINEGNFDLKEVKDATAASIIIQLWLTNEDVKKIVPISRENLKLILGKIRFKITKIILMDLIDLYFINYDLLGDAGTVLVRFIKKKKSLLKRTSIIRQIDKLLDENFTSHVRIVEFALRKKESLTKVLISYGLYPIATSIFQKRARYYMYIKRAETEELEQLIPLIKEIENNKIYLKEYLFDGKEKNYLIGHKIIEIFLNRLNDYYIEIKKYRYILDFILAIAGDPRSSDTTDSYVKWWNILGKENISKMKKYLSSFDLNMFLETYENYITETGYESEERMYLERKCFLRGMLEEGLIQETKLFVGLDMEAFLRETYQDASVKPTYFIINDSSKMCVIFMKYNNYLFTEGAFNCTFRMYENPDEIKVFTSRKKDYYYREIGKGLEEEVPPIMKQVHSINWQSRVLNLFRIHLKKQLNHRLFYRRDMFGGF